MEEQSKFGLGDYAVFIAMMGVSILIGIFYAWKDSKEKDVEMYLVGGRDMSPVPVAISLCVSYVSGLMMVGLPTQVYYYGLIISSWMYITLFGPLITAVYYIPVYFRLNITSVYEMIYMGLVTYIPCLSLSAVSEVSMNVSIIITCVICTFYTTLGGLKAVVWTDVVQASVMVAGMIAVIVAATVASGGLTEVYNALERSDRWEFFYWDTDPYVRNATPSLVIGGFIVWTFMASVNQPMVQRFISCRSVNGARVAVGLLVLPQLLFLFMASFTGAVMYAYFENCDPLDAGYIEARDQAVPYMVIKLFQGTPGLAGLYVAAVYSGTLSTISSGINALSAVLLNDYILPIKPKWKAYNLKLSKFLVFLLGIMVLLVTFLVKAMGSLVIEAFVSAFGSIGGPLLGVYTMAVFIPVVNEKGAVIGQIAGTGLSFWLAIGQIIYPPGEEYLRVKSVYTTECPIVNSTSEFTTTPVITTTEEPSDGESIYSLSNNYFSLVGFSSCIIIGIIVSGFTGFNKPAEANTLIFTPLVDNKILPEKVRKFFRFGVPERVETVQTPVDEVLLGETKNGKIHP